MFKNRQEALTRLIDILDKDIVQNCVVLSISKNGNFYAREIALRFGMLEGDFLFIEEVISPINKEVSLAAVSETKESIIIKELIESFEISDDFIYNEIERVYEDKILENIHKFRAGEGIISLENRNVLLVDEGANTGLTLLCAIKSCINKKVNSINVALPLVAKDTAEMVEKIVDNTFFVKIIEDYVDTKFYFKEYDSEL
ncbi:phosphoribosyltransferase family protein [Caminibacter sp.]